MNDKHSGFDEQACFDLKQSNMGYRFCPRCMTPLSQDELDGHQRMVCPSPACGFVFYQNPIPAAGAIIVEGDSVLLVKRAHPPRIGWWTLPAGFMEWDEHPTDTVVRELEEETGLKVELDQLFEVYSGSDDCRNNAVLILYTAHRVGGELAAGDDAAEARYFSFDELPDNIAFISHRQALSDYDQRFRRG